MGVAARGLCIFSSFQHSILLLFRFHSRDVFRFSSFQGRAWMPPALNYFFSGPLFFFGGFLSWWFNARMRSVGIGAGYLVHADEEVGQSERHWWVLPTSTNSGRFRWSSDRPSSNPIIFVIKNAWHLNEPNTPLSARTPSANHDDPT